MPLSPSPKKKNLAANSLPKNISASGQSGQFLEGKEIFEEAKAGTGED